MNYYEIGQRIRKIRKAHGLSQEELAEKIGISTTHIRCIDRNILVRSREQRDNR